MTPREQIDDLVKSVLGPLLERDGGGIEVVSLAGSTITVRLTGALRGCPGTSYVKRGVIEPALASILGEDLDIIYELPPTD